MPPSPPLNLPAHHPESRLAFALRRWKMHRRFRRKIGIAGNFEQPKSYYEKIQYRKLYGNHGFYALAADKYRARDYVAQRVGTEHLIPQLAVCDRLSAEILAPLAAPFIIQANHGCKWHRIVRDKSQLNIPDTVTYFNRLMRRSYGTRTGDYHYSLIPPKILINKLLLVDGDVPADYNFYCYNGPKGFDFCLAVALPGQDEYMYFDRDWNIWEGDFTPQQRQRYMHPKNYDRMVEIARELGRDFDFVRVDLFNVDGHIYFSELTCTPATGMTPVKNQFRLGKRTDMWHLDVDNPLLYRKP